MRPFQILNPATLEEAQSALGDRAGTTIIAGGTDIMGELHEGTASPAALVSIAGVGGLRGIEVSDSGASIGGLVTLAEIASNPDISQSYPALAQAAASVATPQIRNVGTLGGNLCQRPRCWYYRSPKFNCLKRGGDTCYAVDGLNKYHAIFGSGGCYIVHPSDTAVALLALGASVEIRGEDRDADAAGVGLLRDAGRGYGAGDGAARRRDRNPRNPAAVGRREKRLSEGEGAPSVRFRAGQRGGHDAR